MIDLFPDNQKDENIPLYMQVYHKIRNDILCGAMPPGSKLPSIRNLSADLKLSKHTVETAYSQLIADGIIKSVDRSGLYVEEMSDWFGKTGDADKLTAHCPAGSDCAVPVRYNFDNAIVDIDSFPYSQYKKVIGSCIDKYFAELLLCGDPQGDFGLRSEISKYVFSLRGVVCSPEQIIISSGTQHAVTLLCQILSNVHKTIAFEDPSELHIRTVFEDFNFEIVPIPVEGDGINVKRIKLFDVKTVFVTPSHQFPYGMTMSLEKRMSLIKWAKENDGLVIEDDYECEFKNTSAAVKSLQGLDDSGKVVYLGTFSKVLMPSIRISYLILPQKLLDIYKRKYSKYNQPVPRIIQKSAEIFIKEGYMEKHLRKSRALYKEKRRAMIDSITCSFGNKATIVSTDSSLHLLLRVKTALSEQTLVNKAQQAGILVKPTSMHWSSANSTPFPEIIIGFAGIRLEDIPSGIQALCECWFGK